VTGVLGRGPRPDEPSIQAPRLTQNYNQEFWEENKEKLLASDVAQWAGLGANTRDCLGLVLPAVGRCLRKVPRLIVDIGSGLGITTHSLAEAFPDSRVVGLELSPDAIDVARATFGRGNLSFMEHDISDPLPFAQGEVDLAVAVNAMAYAKNQLFAARGVFRALSPEGAFVHVSRTLDSHLFWDFPLSCAHPTVFQLNASDYIQAAAAFGFATSVRPVPGLWGMDHEFFQPRRLSRFEKLFAESNKHLKNLPAYLPAMSHAVFSHCRTPAPHPAYLDEPCYLTRLEAVLATMMNLPARSQEAALVGWNCTRVLMGLEHGFSGMLEALLPGVAGMVGTVMTATD
jgi:SAM-dependent methyltransferase